MGDLPATISISTAFLAIWVAALWTGTGRPISQNYFMKLLIWTKISGTILYPNSRKISTWNLRYLSHRLLSSKFWVSWNIYRFLFYSPCSQRKFPITIKMNHKEQPSKNENLCHAHLPWMYVEHVLVCMQYTDKLRQWHRSIYLLDYDYHELVWIANWHDRRSI